MNLYGKIGFTIFLFALVVSIGFLMPLSMVVYSDHIFGGTESFDTYAQAMSFQEKIAHEAEIYGATSEITISKSSPPKVTWHVLFPTMGFIDSLTPRVITFPYGVERTSVLFMWTCVGISTLISLLICGWVAKEIWKDRSPWNDET